MNPKPKVLLIFPGNRMWGFTYPLGLIYVANALMKIGVEVKILNLGNESIHQIKNEKYLFVGITMLTGKMISIGLQAAKVIKENDSSTPVVLGGVHPSVMPEQSLENKYVDIVVVGEGEITVQELAKRLIAGENLEGIQGVAFKDKSGKIIMNPPRDFIDLNTLDFDLPYDLLGTKFYKSSTIPVHTSRGCPYRCTFCYSTYFNRRKYRTKSAELVADEIEFLYKKYGFRNFNFDFEDEFFIDPVRVCRIFELVMKKGLDIRWSSFCRFDTFARTYEKLGDEFPQLLKKSGLYFLGLGAESGSQRLLDEVIKKDITLPQIHKTVEILRNHKIPHRVTIITCFPTETKADIEDDFKLVDTIAKDNPYLFTTFLNLTPLPGTPIFDLLKKDYNFKPPASLEEWGDYPIPMDVKKMDWIPPAHAEFCRKLLKLSTGLFYRDLKSFKEYEENNYATGMPYAPGRISYILSKIERWRYKHRNFKLMIEVEVAGSILGVFYNIRTYLVNFILKKYLSEAVFKSLKRRFGDKSWRSEKK